MLRPDEQAAKERALNPWLRGDDHLVARFTRHARTDIPMLVERLEEARGKLEAVREWKRGTKGWAELDRILRSEGGE